MLKEKLNLFHLMQHSLSIVVWGLESDWHGLCRWLCNSAAVRPWAHRSAPPSFSFFIEIVPREAGGTAGAKVGQNMASVTGGAGERTPALAGPAGGVTFCREMRHGGNP